MPQGDATYDSARANMGEPWMMFTKDQGWELIKYTFSGWTTINGVNGYKFFNKTDLSIYIFLPAAGEWGEQSLSTAGEQGNYLSTKWIKSNNSKYICRLQFYYNQYSSELKMYDYTYPSRGASVRGIRPL